MAARSRKLECVSQFNGFIEGRFVRFFVGEVYEGSDVEFAAKAHPDYFTTSAKVAVEEEIEVEPEPDSEPEPDVVMDLPNIRKSNIGKPSKR